MTDVFKAKGTTGQNILTKTSQDNLTQVLVDDPVALVDDPSASVGAPTTINTSIIAHTKIDKATGR